MNEKTSKKLVGAGASGIAVGVIVIVCGIVCGVISIINGARVLGSRRDLEI